MRSEEPYCANVGVCDGGVFLVHGLLVFYS
jgi:hypothetical protein